MTTIPGTQDSSSKPQQPPLGAQQQNVQSRTQGTQPQGRSAQELADARLKASSALSQEFQNFLTDIESLFKATTSLTGAELENAKVKINERIAVAKTKASELSTTFTQQARDTFAATDKYVHEEPWKAVGAGAALGLLVGFLVARRN